MRIKDGINPVDRVNAVAAESESSSEENETAEEIQQSTEIQKFEEFGRDTLKDSVSKRKKTSYKSAQKRVLTTMMAVSAVVVLTVSPISIFEPIFGPVLDPVFGPVLDPDYGDQEDPGYEGGVTGGFSEVVASEDTIWYTVSLEGLQGDETITVDLTNRFTDRSSTVGGDGDSGSQTGLKLRHSRDAARGRDLLPLRGRGVHLPHRRDVPLLRRDHRRRGAARIHGDAHRLVR